MKYVSSQNKIIFDFLLSRQDDADDAINTISVMVNGEGEHITRHTALSLWW